MARFKTLFLFLLAVLTLVQAFGFAADADRDESIPFKFKPLPVHPKALKHPDEEFARITAKIQDGTANEIERRSWYELRKRYWPYTGQAMPSLQWKENALRQGERIAAHRSAAKLTSAPSAFTYTWTHLGPLDFCAGDPPAAGCVDKGTGRGTALWVNPANKNEILAGFADGGVWKTTDQGTNWTPVFDQQAALSVGSIDAFIPSGTFNSNAVIYVATGEGNFNGDAVEGVGVFKSTDGGTNWTHQTIPFLAGMAPNRTSIRRIAVDPNNTQNVWAAADSGMFRTTDGGSNWTLVSSLPYYQKNAGDCWFVYMTDVLIDDSTNPSTVYAAGVRPFDAGCSASARQDNGVYRSTDDGATWVNIAQTAAACPVGRGYTCAGSGFATLPGSVGRISLIRSNSNKKFLYALVHSTSTDGSLGIWSTSDATTSTVTWTARSTTNYCSAQCWYDMSGAVDPTNAARVLVGGLDAYVSGNNAGTLNKTSSWTGWGTSSYVHADHHHIVWVDSTTVYDIGDGGLYIGTVNNTNANGVTWVDANAGGIDTLQFYGLAQHPTIADQIHGGLQDNGEAQALVSGGVITGWTQAAGGDGGFSATDQTTPANTFEEYVYAIMSKSGDGGATYGSCFRDFGTCTQGGPNGNCSGSCVPDSATEFIAPMTLDANSQTILYTGSKFVYRNSPAGSAANGAWKAYSPDLSAGSTAGDDIVNIHSAKNNGTPGTLWAGTTNGHVWMTTGATGATAPTWTDTTKSPLPARSVTWLTTDPANGQNALVTFSGYNSGHVFRTTNGGTTWTDISGALPDEPFDSIAVNPANTAEAYAGSDFGVYVNDDIWNTNTWTKINSGQLPLVRANQLEFSPANGKLRVATHGRGIWELTVTGSCTPPGAPSIDSITDEDACAQSGVHVNYTAGAGATGHDLYVDGNLAVTGYASGALYNPGDTASHDYVVRASQGACTTDSSPSSFADANNAPTPTITGATTNTCPAITVDLSTEAGKTNYQWLLNGNPIGGANAETYQASATGDYTVSFTDSGCTGTSATHTVTLSGCAGAGNLQLSQATYSIGEGGGNVTITVSRVGGSAGAVSVLLNTSDGSATAGSDYTAQVDVAVNFADGDATDKTVLIPILQDLAVEPTEDFTVTLSSPTGGAALGTPSSATVSILDDDSGPSCLFCDEFDDSTLSPSWTYIKPTAWSEDGNNLVGTYPRKASTLATPVFAGCTTCTIESTMQTAGGLFNKVYMVGWYLDNKNYVELLMKQETGRWVLKQRVNGIVAAKNKGVATINVNQAYVAQVAFNGTQFTVSIDGTPLITLNKAAGSTPQGTVGFRVKATTGTFGYIHVN